MEMNNLIKPLALGKVFKKIFIQYKIINSNN